MSELYNFLIREPILNLIQIFFNITNDTGWSIVLIGIAINLAIWPLFAKSYVNSQKMRLLQPEIKKIQEKHKGNPQVLYQKTREFYQKHDIKNGSTFLTLIVQILLLSGLFFIIRSISNEESIDGIYGWISNNSTASFNDHAFGAFKITEDASKYVWMPLITATMTYLTGMYNFRWGPRPKMLKKEKEKKKDPKKEPSMGESFQKSMEFQSLYVLPVIFFFVNLTWSVGLNIYFLTSSTLGLIRQVYLSNYYSKNTDKLLNDVAKSDPTSKDDDPSNNLEITAKPGQIANQEVAAKVIKNKNAKKTKSSKKKKVAKKKKK